MSTTFTDPTVLAPESDGTVCAPATIRLHNGTEVYVGLTKPSSPFDRRGTPTVILATSYRRATALMDTDETRALIRALTDAADRCDGIDHHPDAGTVIVGADDDGWIQITVEPGRPGYVGIIAACPEGMAGARATPVEARLIAAALSYIILTTMRMRAQESAQRRERAIDHRTGGSDAEVGSA